MTFRIISNTYASSQQPSHVAAGSGGSCSTLNNSQQLQQHQLSPGAGEHLCTRFCCFEPLFGNVFRCQTSGITHVCDQGCHERIFLDNHFDICRYVHSMNTNCSWVCIRLSVHAVHHERNLCLCLCRFSKKLFPTHKLAETASRKRCLADSSTGGSSKLSNVMPRWSSSPWPRAVRM